MSEFEAGSRYILNILGILAFFAGWPGAFLAILFGVIVESNARTAIRYLEPEHRESLLKPYHGRLIDLLADAHAVIDDPYIDRCRRRYVMAHRLAFVSFGAVVLGFFVFVAA